MKKLLVGYFMAVAAAGVIAAFAVATAWSVAAQVSASRSKIIVTVLERAAEPIVPTASRPTCLPARQAGSVAVGGLGERSIYRLPGAVRLNYTGGGESQYLAAATGDQVIDYYARQLAGQCWQLVVVQSGGAIWSRDNQVLTIATQAQPESGQSLVDYRLAYGQVLGSAFQAAQTSPPPDGGSTSPPPPPPTTPPPPPPDGSSYQQPPTGGTYSPPPGGSYTPPPGGGTGSNVQYPPPPSGGGYPSGPMPPGSPYPGAYPGSGDHQGQPGGYPGGPGGPGYGSGPGGSGPGGPGGSGGPGGPGGYPGGGPGGPGSGYGPGPGGFGQGQGSGEQGFGSGQPGQWQGPSEEEMEKMMKQQQEQQFQMMKQGAGQMERGMKQGLNQMRTGLKFLERACGLKIPEAQAAMDAILPLLQKVKDAQDFEALGDAFNDVQEAAMNLEETGQNMAGYGQLCSANKEIDRRIKPFTREINSLINRAAKHKNEDIKALGATLKAKFDELLALIQQEKELKKTAPDQALALLEGSMEGLYEDVNNLKNAVQAALQGSQGLRTLSNDIKKFSRTIAAQKKAGKDVSEAESQLAVLQEAVAAAQAALKENPEEFVAAIEAAYEARETLLDALGQVTGRTQEGFEFSDIKSNQKNIDFEIGEGFRRPGSEGSGAGGFGQGSGGPGGFGPGGGGFGPPGGGFGPGPGGPGGFGPPGGGGFGPGPSLPSGGSSQP